MQAALNASADWMDFAPPRTRGLGRALALAILAHLVLVAALTLGVQWRRDAPMTTVEAELWAAIPKPAAPRQVEPPPAPPAPAAPPAPRATPKTPDADIALEQEKQRKAQEKLQAQRALEQQRQEQRKRAQEQRAQELKVAQEKKKREDERRRQEVAARQEAVRAQQQAAQEKKEAIVLETLRKDNLQRIAGMAGATGGAAASGSAQRASGPSGSYAARVSASVKPNIVYIEDSSANPVALVEVRAAPDGSIVSRRLLKGSGNKAWDEAVLRAIDKTAVLPRDVDGTVPPLLEINFRRRD